MPSRIYHPALTIVLLFCVVSFLSSVHADTSSEALRVVKAGHMLDITSGKWLRERYIVVEGETISTIADNAPTAPHELIDLGDYYVLPGLIDLHVHLTSSAEIHGYARLSRSIPRSAIYSVTAAKVTLDAGFTTVRNVGAPGFADVALRDAINDGEIPGPRMRVAGRSICITGGHCDGALLAPRYAIESPSTANGPWEVKKAVRENIKYGADVIKFSASGGVLSSGTDVNASQFSLEEMQALVAEAHDRGRIVAAHAHGKNGIKRAIRAGVDSVEHASLIDDEGIRLAKKNGTTLVMDIYVSDFILQEGEKAGILPASLEKERQVGRAQRESFQKAHKAGVNLAFGSDAGVYPHGLNARQFAYMVKWGMSELEAIQAATLDAAKLLNWRNREGQLRVGELKPGSFADMVAIKTNPLESIRALEAIEIVIKGGHIVKGD